MRTALSNVMSSRVKKCLKCMECPECGQDPNYHYLVNQDLPNVLASKNNLPEIDKNSMFYFSDNYLGYQWGTRSDTRVL